MKLYDDFSICLTKKERKKKKSQEVSLFNCFQQWGGREACCVSSSCFHERSHMSFLRQHLEGWSMTGSFSEYGPQTVLLKKCSSCPWQFFAGSTGYLGKILTSKETCMVSLRTTLAKSPYGIALITYLPRHNPFKWFSIDYTFTQNPLTWKLKLSLEIFLDSLTPGNIHHLIFVAL